MEMTIEQFKALAATAHFTTNQNIEGGGESELVTGHTDDGDEITVDVAYACIWKTAATKLDSGQPVEITFQQGVQWQGTENTRTSDDFETYRDTNCDAWVLTGITLIDDDGDKIGRRDVEDCLMREAFGPGCAVDLTDIDIDALIPAVTTLDIDLESDMEEFVVERDNEPNIRFTGELVASASSRDGNQATRWTVLKLWKTKGGKFICQSIGRTQWQGEVDRFSGAVCDDEAGVVAFFKHGRVAKELYDEAGIDATQAVE